MYRSLADFEGEWRIERRIVQAKGPEARFGGRAVFVPDGEGLRYEERGVLTVEGHAPVEAHRAYLWRQGAGRAIEVLFEDGRAFHRIDPERPEDRHWCDPDEYEVAYRFDGWPVWRSCWVVRGPRKDYRMESTYRRAG